MQSVAIQGMRDRVVAVLPVTYRSALASELPEWVEPRWFSGLLQAHELGSAAEIGWFDTLSKKEMSSAIHLADRIRWLNTALTGMDGLPLQTLRQRGVVVTNGAGLNAHTIAEYVLMGMLTIAKGYRDVVRAQERRQWLTDAPGKVELAGSRALILGYGAIGQMVEARLKAFDVDVSVARNSAGSGSNMLGPDEWRSRLGEFDWVIVAVPATSQTLRMIGPAELGAFKRSAVLLNVARGSVVDHAALVTALSARRIAAAFLDVTDPEPLPEDHPLWSLDNAHLTMHLSGRSQTKIFARAARRFLDNLDLYGCGRPLHHCVDLSRGY